MPVTGIPVDEQAVQAAVRDRLSGLDERFGQNIRVRIDEKGTLA